MNRSSNEKKVSDVVLPRILHYLRVIQQLARSNMTTISSEELSKIANISAFQIRKDLANFGKFGQPGTGYDVSNLKRYLLDVIGTKEMCNIGLVGVGNLGSALLNYKGFDEEGLQFVAAFDKEESKIGKLCGNVIVEHINNLKESVQKNNVHIGIIAVSANNAQMVADKLIEAGIFSILNFAPTIVSTPKEITVRDVDLSNELKALRYFTAVNK
ncbi:MAG: redox-sensing transcriptional repressor Rex [Candidatus Omnitrophica bacterium]|nr:redox-sensing transcriptional repressor Rex [Candidatus Omnitrophota bacterium]